MFGAAAAVQHAEVEGGRTEQGVLRHRDAALADAIEQADEVPERVDAFLRRGAVRLAAV